MPIGEVSRKTLADCRNYARFYVRPLLGSRKAGDVTQEVILAWPRRLGSDGKLRTADRWPPTRSVWLELRWRVRSSWPCRRGSCQ
jgi:hypothetical protein